MRLMSLCLSYFLKHDLHGEIRLKAFVFFFPYTFMT